MKKGEIDREMCLQELTLIGFTIEVCHLRYHCLWFVSVLLFNFWVFFYCLLLKVLKANKKSCLKELLLNQKF